MQALDVHAGCEWVAVNVAVSVADCVRAVNVNVQAVDVNVILKGVVNVRL